MFAGLGVILIVVGAILAFAIDRQVDGADLYTIGLILIGGGVLCLIVGAIQGAGWMSMRRSRAISETHVSPDGRHVVEEVDTR